MFLKKYKLILTYGLNLGPNIPKGGTQASEAETGGVCRGSDILNYLYGNVDMYIILEKSNT